MTEKSEKSPMASIIVLAYDNVEYLERTVTTLRDHTDYPNFEIIISNNGIGVPLEEEIHDFCLHFMQCQESTDICDVRYIQNTENLLHGKGCMQGFKLINEKSEYIVFCNDDIFVPASRDKWLQRMVNFMNERPNVATVTPALYSAKEKVYWIGKQNPKQPNHDFLHVPKGDLRLPQEPIITCYNNFACILTRRYLVDEIPIGQSCPHYGSDSEFANRIKDAYPRMIHYVIPGIMLYHYNIYYKRFNYGKDKKVEG